MKNTWIKTNFRLFYSKYVLYSFVTWLASHKINFTTFKLVFGNHMFLLLSNSCSCNVQNWGNKSENLSFLPLCLYYWTSPPRPRTGETRTRQNLYFVGVQPMGAQTQTRIQTKNLADWMTDKGWGKIDRIFATFLLVDEYKINSGVGC